jgi:hypothetical protein
LLSGAVGTRRPSKIPAANPGKDPRPTLNMEFPTNLSACRAGNFMINTGRGEVMLKRQWGFLLFKGV